MIDDTAHLPLTNAVMVSSPFPSNRSNINNFTSNNKSNLLSKQTSHSCCRVKSTAHKEGVLSSD